MNNLTLIIDARESTLYENIIDRDLDKYQDNINIMKEQLELGDIVIQYNDIYHVFERKTVADLFSSIQDGRYKEQKRRLLSNIDLHSITYIIEGDNVLSTLSYNSNKNVLLGAYLHTLFRDNIRVLFTKNITETSTLVLTIATKIIDNPDKFLPHCIDNSCVYADSLKLKKCKIDNIDPYNCYIMQLSQIPHISSIIAKNIAKIYPNMKTLISSCNDCHDDDQKIKLLCQIEKIGKEKAKNIIKYLDL